MFGDVNECMVKSMTLAQEYLFQCHIWLPDRLQREYTADHT